MKPEEQISDLNLREKLSHIDQMLAQHDRFRQQLALEPIRYQQIAQQMRFAPWQVAFAGMTAGAALFAAGAAFMKFFGI
jgi:hypothetical protein